MKPLGTTMGMRNFFTCIGVLLLTVSVAQSSKEKPGEIRSLWNFKPKQGSIEWSLMPAYGHLLIASDSAIYGMDPLSGDVRWYSTELDHVAKSSVHTMDGGQFIHIDHAEWGPSIVNLTDGSIPFKTKGSEIDEYQGSAVASDPCALFVWGSSRSGLRVMQRYCIGSDKPGWSLDLPPSSIIEHELRGNSELILHSAKDIYSIDIGTGELNWSRSFGKSGASAPSGDMGTSPMIVSDPNMGDFFVLESAEGTGDTRSSSEKKVFSINGHSKFNGEPRWAQPHYIKGGIRSVSVLEGYLLVTDLEGMITSLDASSGKMVWERMSDGGAGTKVLGIRNGEGCLIVETFADGQRAYILDAASGKPINEATSFNEPISKVESLPGGFVIQGNEYVLFKPIKQQKKERLDLLFRPHTVETSGNTGFGIGYKDGSLTRISLTSSDWATRKLASRIDTLEMEVERLTMNGNDAIVQYPNKILRINERGRTIWQLDVPKGDSSSACADEATTTGSRSRVLTKDGWEDLFSFEDRTIVEVLEPDEGTATTARKTSTEGGTLSKVGSAGVLSKSDGTTDKGSAGTMLDTEILQQKMAIATGIPLINEVLVIIDHNGNSSAALSALDLRSGSRTEATSVPLTGGKSIFRDCIHSIVYVTGTSEIVCYGFHE